MGDKLVGAGALLGALLASLNLWWGTDVPRVVRLGLALTALSLMTAGAVMRFRSRRRG